MGKAERRLELLRAARDVFATKGFHDAKVDDIVASANVAKGTFYLYFPDKRSVFEELVDGVFARLGGAILKVDPQADIEAQIKHNIRAIVAVLLDDPAVTQLLLSHATGLDPEFAAKIRSFYDGVKELLRESLDDGQRIGIVAQGDTRYFATFTIGALKETLLERSRSGGSLKAQGEAGAPGVNREEIVTELFGFLQRGFLRVPEPLRASGPLRATEPAAAARLAHAGKEAPVAARPARAVHPAPPADRPVIRPSGARPRRGRGADKNIK